MDAPKLRTLLLLFSGISLCACYLSHGPPDDAPAPSELGMPAGTAAPPAVPPGFVHPPVPDAGAFFATPCDAPSHEPRPVSLDVLFVVDDSRSMREEQASLARELPRLIDALTAATHGGGIQLVRDLHLGVVSTDMGIGSIEGIPQCQGFGHDGVLRNVSSGAAGCRPTYPRFLEHTPGRDDAATTARDFACIATLGTEGCGFEQQLEAALKALWPAHDVALPGGRRIDASAVTFPTGPGGRPPGLGRGTRENAGFLRHGDPSVIAVVVVTDEDDCSAADSSIFTPDLYLDPSDPLASQGLNLRCFFNPDGLHPVERYLAGLTALRPGLPRHVFFAAIAGVPVDLVDARTLSGLDADEPASVEAFYQRILDHPRMRKVQDHTRPPEAGGGLVPSCETVHGRAFPPRRLVELARRFGPSGIVQSICQPDFAPAIDAIVTRLVAAAAEAACSR